jgi:CheY-like chemotaxis protein
MLEGKRIFIVEDDLRNRLVYKMLLPKLGAEVEFESWGPDAVNHLAHWQPVDLIILDLMLQRGASGYDLIKLIRRNNAYANIPVLAISASEPHQAITRTQAAGFSGFIAKPIRQERFGEQIARVIAGEKVWDDGAAIQVSAD